MTKRRDKAPGFHTPDPNFILFILTDRSSRLRDLTYQHPTTLAKRIEKLGW